MDQSKLALKLLNKWHIRSFNQTSFNALVDRAFDQMLEGDVSTVPNPGITDAVMEGGQSVNSSHQLEQDSKEENEDSRTGNEDDSKDVSTENSTGLEGELLNEGNNVSALQRLEMEPVQVEIGLDNEVSVETASIENGGDGGALQAASSLEMVVENLPPESVLNDSENLGVCDGLIGGVIDSRGNENEETGGSSNGSSTQVANDSIDMMWRWWWWPPVDVQLFMPLESEKHVHVGNQLSEEPAQAGNQISEEPAQVENEIPVEPAQVENVDRSDNTAATSSSSDAAPPEMGNDEDDLQALGACALPLASSSNQSACQQNLYDWRHPRWEHRTAEGHPCREKDAPKNKYDGILYCQKCGALGHHPSSECTAFSEDRRWYEFSLDLDSAYPDRVANRQKRKLNHLKKSKGVEAFDGTRLRRNVIEQRLQVVHRHMEEVLTLIRARGNEEAERTFTFVVRIRIQILREREFEVWEWNKWWNSLMSFIRYYRAIFTPN